MGKNSTQKHTPLFKPMSCVMHAHAVFCTRILSCSSTTNHQHNMQSVNVSILYLGSYFILLHSNHAPSLLWHIFTHNICWQSEMAPLQKVKNPWIDLFNSKHGECCGFVNVRKKYVILIHLLLLPASRTASFLSSSKNCSSSNFYIQGASFLFDR